MKYLMTAFFVLAACADPKYLPAESAQNIQQQGAATCNLQFQKSGICLDWKWEKVPTETEMGTLYFKTYRKNMLDGSAVLLDQTVTPAVVLWMPSMNHGSSPVSTSREDIGTYRAKDVFFIMPGEWEIKFQLKDETQVIDEAIFSLTI